MANETHEIVSTGWQVTLVRDADGNVVDVIIDRPDEKFFTVQMVRDQYPHPMIFEKDQGTRKIGDVALTLREHPTTGRFMVDFDEEKAFTNPSDFKMVVRARRSSLDNAEQAASGNTFVSSGFECANLRRIGGQPIETHFVIENWDPDARTMDVYSYVRSPDGLGLAAFTKALANSFMSKETAHRLLDQVRSR